MKKETLHRFTIEMVSERDMPGLIDTIADRLWYIDGLRHGSVVIRREDPDQYSRVRDNIIDELTVEGSNTCYPFSKGLTPKVEPGSAPPWPYKVNPNPKTSEEVKEFNDMLQQWGSLYRHPLPNSTEQITAAVDGTYYVAGKLIECKAGDPLPMHARIFKGGLVAFYPDSNITDIKSVKEETDPPKDTSVAQEISDSLIRPVPASMDEYKSVFPTAEEVHNTLSLGVREAIDEFANYKLTEPSADTINKDNLTRDQFDKIASALVADMDFSQLESQ